MQFFAFKVSCVVLNSFNCCILSFHPINTGEYHYLIPSKATNRSSLLSLAKVINYRNSNLMKARNVSRIYTPWYWNYSCVIQISYSCKLWSFKAVKNPRLFPCFQPLGTWKNFHAYVLINFLTYSTS